MSEEAVPQAPVEQPAEETPAQPSVGLFSQEFQPKPPEQAPPVAPVENQPAPEPVLPDYFSKMGVNVDNLKSNKDFVKLVSDIKTPENFIESFFEAKKLASLPEEKRNQILAKGADNLIPDEDASPEEMERFYKKLGKPDSPEKYPTVQGVEEKDLGKF